MAATERRNTRALAFPRAFSVMVGTLTGRVVDVLRVLSSTKTYRASVADVTRRLIEKGMAVEAAEFALTYATGRPVELVTGLITDVHVAMGEDIQPALRDSEAVLQAVLSRMWPEVVQAVERLDTRSTAGKAKHAKLLAGPPLTSLGRPMTAKEIRAKALADVIAGQVPEPKLVPPRTVQEAREQARKHTAADRLAMNRGVSAETLLAGTAGGKALGMTEPDETSGAGGWTEQGVPKPGNARPKGDAELLSPGQMLKQIRGEK